MKKEGEIGDGKNVLKNKLFVIKVIYIFVSAKKTGDLQYQ